MRLATIVPGAGVFLARAGGEEAGVWDWVRWVDEGCWVDGTGFAAGVG